MMRPRFPQRTPVEWAEALGNLVRRGREYVGPCPLCGGTDRFHVAPGRDRDAARVGCRHCIDGHPDDVRRLRYGELARAVFGDSGNPEQLRPPPATSVDRSNRLSVPRLPPTGRPIPADANHPVRRWLSARNLWRQGYPLPAGLGVMRPDSRYPPTCAVRLAARLAPFSAWANAWPHPPTPTAVQIIAVDADGHPTLDRPKNAGGLAKRTMGTAGGAVFAVGNPDASAIRVCEGIADALAIASRYDALVIAAMSDGQMAHPRPDLLARFVNAAGVVIHADADHNVAGQGAALRLASIINREGGHARAVLTAQGHKDVADWAAQHPHPPVDRTAARSHAHTLTAMYPGWPTSEIYRLAGIAASDAQE